MSRKAHRGLSHPPLVLGGQAPQWPTLEERSPAASEPTPAIDGAEAADEAIFVPTAAPSVEAEPPPPPSLSPISDIVLEFEGTSRKPDRKAKPVKPPVDKAAERAAKAAAKAERRAAAEAEKLRRKAKPVIATPIEADAAPAVEAPAPPAGPALPILPGWARWAYPGAIALAVAWGGSLIAFTQSYQHHDGPFGLPMVPPVVLGALAFLPAVFILIGAYLLRQTANIAMETRRARSIAEDLAVPAALAADQAGGAAEAVRREIALATEAGEAAERKLQALRQTLAYESARLIAATEDAERTARTLTESLSRERAAMVSLTGGLGEQVEAVNDAIARQTRMVTETSDLAAVQLQEAEAALAARAGDLTTAASTAGEAAELAGEALGRQVDRLENAGELVGARLQALNDDMARGHSRLADLAVQLQADQENLAARLESQRLAAASAAADAQAAVGAITENAETTALTLRDLIAEADERLRSVAEAVQGEQAALDARSRAALSLFRDAVAEERSAIEAETQAAIGALAGAAEAARTAAAADFEAAAGQLRAAEQAVAAQAEAARAQVEQLGEAAFAAAQKADQAFDSRMTAARRAIEQSAALLEEAGSASVGRIDAGLSAARAALGELDGLLSAVDQRVAALPLETRTHADQVRAAVESGLAELSASARRIAGETEAVDTALQERVRRNYEMLSEALKTMGKVAAVTEQAAIRAATPAPLPTPAPAPRPAVAAPRPTLRVTPAEPAPVAESSAYADRAIRVPPVAAPAPRPAPRPEPMASSEIGLRPRLRLTAEQEAAVLREAEPARPAAAPAAMRPEPIRQEPVRQEPLRSEPPRAARPAPDVRESLEAFQRPIDRINERSARDASRDTGRDGGWTWKDLLSSIDEPPIDDEVLAERLIAEIEAMGLDAAHLLPLARIDEIAAAVQRGDGERAREAVRGLAPGAVRRLSRRVLTDKILRAQADRYVQRYEDLLSDSAKRDREGFMTAALLGSDPGRAFLLFNAAVGELH